MSLKIYDDLPEDMKKIIKIANKLSCLDLLYLVSYFKELGVDRLKAAMVGSKTYNELRNKGEVIDRRKNSRIP